MSEAAEHGERIEVRVESLDFEGVAVRDPARVQAAFTIELTRLLQERGLPERRGGLSAGADVDGGTLASGELDDPDRLGRSLAHRVYGGLSR